MDNKNSLIEEAERLYESLVKLGNAVLESLPAWVRNMPNRIMDILSKKDKN